MSEPTASFGPVPTPEHLRRALVALWPDRPRVLFVPREGDDAPVLTPDEVNLLTRVAMTISDAERRGGEEALGPLRALFAGDPDTPCRTTHRHDSTLAPTLDPVATECVEVPLDELRAAFDEAERAIEGRA